ncbi:LuxR C-terminal-related transcriptional regulator [Streptomyces sp. NPDC004111]|uniref:LuxR C-terminal-related transcriptional regulator n=1 Tax=Streptomyces sp. NPDC004111 TaxID=3364690 RepID=UPI0036CA1191
MSESTGEPSFRGPRLSAAAAALHARLGVGEAIDVVADEPALAELVEMRLALRHPRVPERPTLLTRADAERAMREGVEQQLGEAFAYMEGIPSFLDELHTRSRRSCGGVTWVDGGDGVNALINGIAAQAEKLLASQPGLQRNVREVLPTERDIALLERGGSIRTLYPASARHEGIQQQWVNSVAPLGAQVRTLHGRFMRYIVADRRHLIMRDHVADRTPTEGAYHVTDPAVIAFVAEWFELDWARATPWGADASLPGEAITNALQRSILRELCAGLDQGQIAKRLTYSKRTVTNALTKLREKLGFATLYQVVAWWATSDEQELD